MSKITLSNPAGQIIRDMTVEEETERTAKEAQTAIVEQAEADAKTATDIKKATGKQKLKDLGLNDDEIKALTGA